MSKDQGNITTFRCKHRHTALTHPGCYIKFIGGDSGKVRLPKVLVFDIETSPVQAYVWQHSVWGGNVSENQVISQWFMLTWAAKWLFDDKIMSSGLTSKEALAEDDNRIVKQLWKLLDEADIVIAHNGNRFDVPNMNTRFIVNELPPPSPYQTIDTVLVARRQFGFTHNNLNALAKVFGFDVKLDTDFNLWKSCISGDAKSLKYMEEYNAGDVQLLEDIYMKLRPWIKSHPNLGLYVESDEPVCPNCGSSNIEWTNKFYYTQTGKYATYRCQCGCFGRSRKSVLNSEVKYSLTVPMSR
jgi:hypothetical protein